MYTFTICTFNIGMHIYWVPTKWQISDARFMCMSEHIKQYINGALQGCNKAALLLLHFSLEIYSLQLVWWSLNALI